MRGMEGTGSSTVFSSGALEIEPGLMHAKHKVPSGHFPALCFKFLKRS